jgi:hypothetical protein
MIVSSSVESASLCEKLILYSSTNLNPLFIFFCLRKRSKKKKMFPIFVEMWVVAGSAGLCGEVSNSND